MLNTDKIVLPYYRVRGKEGTSIDPTVASYSGEQDRCMAKYFARYV